MYCTWSKIVTSFEDHSGRIYSEVKFEFLSASSFTIFFAEHFNFKLESFQKISETTRGLIFMRLREIFCPNVCISIFDCKIFYSDILRAYF